MYAGRQPTAGVHYSYWGMSAGREASGSTQGLVSILPNASLQKAGLYLENEYRMPVPLALTGAQTLIASVSRGFKVATPVERYVAAPMLDVKGVQRFTNIGESEVMGPVAPRV